MLAAENVKATEAVEKISTLDESLSQIEQRITEMNVAREWVANSESRLKELDKEVRTQLKLFGSLLERSSKGVKQKEGDKGAPPPQHRENAIRLKNQGWKNEEIAKTLGMSIGELELILEIDSRG
jgi:DNA-binding NarL/FixJ family response regulator